MNIFPNGSNWNRWFLRVRYSVLCFFFYILMIFLILYRINLILPCLPMTRVLLLQISNLLAFRKNINEFFTELNAWFQGNLLSLNYDKTYFLELLSKKNQLINTHIYFRKKHITNIHSIKFLGLSINIPYLGNIILRN
jgi:hypothetical protein